jgi:hypothetical protein
MWYFIIFSGSYAREKEFGVVAEYCPYCERVAACLVTAYVEGWHINGVPAVSTSTDPTCLCGLCGGHFPCQLWKYAGTISADEARSLPAEALLERTNPALKERLEWKRRRHEFGTDPRFVTALDEIDRLRPAGLRVQLLDEMKRWAAMTEAQRDDVAKRVEQCVRASDLAAASAKRFPRQAGCLPASLLCLAVWSAFYWAPGVRALYAGVGVTFAGLFAGASVSHWLMARKVRRWAREVLIPAGKAEGIRFPSFLAVLGGQPSGLRVYDETQPMRDHIEDIRAELLKAGLV